MKRPGWINTVLFVIGTLIVIGVVLMALMHNRVYTPQIVASQLDPYSGVLVVYVEGGQGSCFVVAQQDGWYYVATAAHVVEGENEIEVDDYIAEVVSLDQVNDVALLRFQSLETYTIYSFAKPVVGESCITVGWNGDSRLVYKGNVISADLKGFVAANGGVVPGCSGGVLLDKDGKAIGITVRVSIYRGWAWDSTVLYVPARFAKALMVIMEIE